MKTFSLEVSGDFACFTRPEMKVERVSYDVITPRRRAIRKHNNTSRKSSATYSARSRSWP